MAKRKRLGWKEPLIASQVDAHPDLLSIPTFVLFVQKDELQMSRVEVRKEDRLEAQKEFEMWLEKQTAPRQAPPKKQMQNEESLAPVDDKERSAVAVRLSWDDRIELLEDATLSREGAEEPLSLMICSPRWWDWLVILRRIPRGNAEGALLALGCDFGSGGFRSSGGGGGFGRGRGFGAHAF
jgi:hypothetical protein